MTPHPIDAEALRRLADAAGEGPWMFDRDQNDGWMVVFGGNEHPHGYSIIGSNEYLEPADAEFIAASRAAVPALLDALAAAEHRATRAEAQSAIRGRAVVIYRERARKAETSAAHIWNEGYQAGFSDGPIICACAAWNDSECACGNYGNGETPEPNPYLASETA